MKKKLILKIKFLSFITFIVIIAFLSYYFELHKMINRDQIVAFIDSLGAFGPLIFIILYSVISITIFPASLLSISSGIIWGEYLGSFYTIIAASISSALCFFIARWMGRDFIKKKIEGKRLDKLDNYLEKNGFLYVFIFRIVPIFPWGLVNYASGVSSVKFKDFFFATFLGIIPFSFTYNLIGSTIGNPFNPKKIIILFIIVSIVAAVTIRVRKKLPLHKK